MKKCDFAWRSVTHYQKLPQMGRWICQSRPDGHDRSTAPKLETGHPGILTGHPFIFCILKKYDPSPNCDIHQLWMTVLATIMDDCPSYKPPFSGIFQPATFDKRVILTTLHVDVFVFSLLSIGFPHWVIIVPSKSGTVKSVIVLY